MDNYPPGENGIGQHLGMVQHECENDHIWFAGMFKELGGTFYYNDCDGYCPECGEVDKDYLDG